MRFPALPKSLLSILFFLFVIESISQSVILIPFRKGNKWGFSNEKRDLIIPANYDSASVFIEGMAAVKKGNYWTYIDEAGKEIFPPLLDAAFYFSDSIAKVRYKGLLGLINKKGKFLIEPKYESLEDIGNGLLALKLPGQRTLYGVVYRDGNTCISESLEYIDFFRNGLYAISKNQKKGFINRKGEEIIAALYNRVSNVEEGMVAVMQKENGREIWKYIDTTGNPVGKYNYDYADIFSEGFAVAAESKKFYLINKAGIRVMTFPDNTVSVKKATRGTCIYGLTVTDKNGQQKIKYGMINTSGKSILPAMHDTILRPLPSIIAIKKNKKWSLLDYKGKLLAADKYDSILLKPLFQPNAKEFIVINNKKWGCVNEMGKEFLSIKYDTIGPFYFNKAAVRLQGKWGYVNTSGKEITNIGYQYTFAAIDSLLMCFWQNGLCGWFNDKGKISIAPIYDQNKFKIGGNEYPAQYFFNKQGLTLVKRNGKAGYIDRKGTEYWED